MTECPKGHYGSKCVKECSKTCVDPETCDKKTGHCNGGCQTDWIGELCNDCKYKHLLPYIICKSWFETLDEGYYYSFFISKKCLLLVILRKTKQWYLHKILSYPRNMLRVSWNVYIFIKFVCEEKQNDNSDSPASPR